MAITLYYRCVEDYFEALIQVYDDNFSRDYGFWRHYVEKVICRYLDCGDLKNGFARVKCKDCGHEYLLAFSCKRRHFCPSCHQKRVVEFGEWLVSSVTRFQLLIFTPPFFTVLLTSRCNEIKYTSAG